MENLLKDFLFYHSCIFFFGLQIQFVFCCFCNNQLYIFLKLFFLLNQTKLVVMSLKDDKLYFFHLQLFVDHLDSAGSNPADGRLPFPHAEFSSKRGI